MTSIGREFRTLKDGGLNLGGLFGVVRAVVNHGKLPELTSFLWWELCYRLGALRRIRFTPEAPIIPNDAWSNLEMLRIGGSSSAGLSQSSEPWMLLHFDESNGMYGCYHTTPNLLLYRSQAGQISEVARFRQSVLSIFVARDETVFVCLEDGSIHRRQAGSSGFSQVLVLSSPDSFFRFDHGMVDTGAMLAIAEYGNVRLEDDWQSLAHLYYSLDDGRTWERSDFLIEQGVNKHSHLLRYSPRLDALIVTVGDNKKQTWLAQLSSGAPLDGEVRWTLCNRRHVQTGGFTALVETESAFLFGTDYHGGTNFMVESSDCRKFRKYALPDPYRRGPVYAMTKRVSADGVEIWATLHNAVNRGARSLVMVSRDNGSSWTRVLDYDGSRNRVRFASTTGTGETHTVYLYVTSVDADDNEQPMANFKVHPQVPALGPPKPALVV